VYFAPVYYLEALKASLSILWHTKLLQQGIRRACVE